MSSPIRVVLVLGVLGSAAGAGPILAQQGVVVPPAPKELQNRPTNIVLRLSDDGAPSINNQRIEWARLNAELSAIFDRRPEKILFIETTPRNRAADVRRVVAVARKRGIKVYALFGVTTSG